MPGVPRTAAGSGSGAGFRTVRSVSEAGAAAPSSTTAPATAAACIPLVKASRAAAPAGIKYAEPVIAGAAIGLRASLIRRSGTSV
ncbi:hypothetical protein GCM10010129_45410 [Streptomyces fumigatiscleroticus]|nr:hypothetical protein GCM10010129_45410 [Streptomyces fumigatiscleroticus]